MFGNNSAAAWCGKVGALGKYFKRLEKVFISCDDALKVIKQWDSPQTFFYCDPPYLGADQGHYSGYSVGDFQNLIDTLNSCEGSFLVSCYNCDVSIPEDWEKFEFSAYSSAKKNSNKQTGARTEVVYSRFNRVRPRDEIVKLYQSGAYDCYRANVLDLI